jgi:hypothetical protein
MSKKPLEGMRLFISGPMSSDGNNNVTKFLTAHIVLNRLGALSVYDPAVEWVDDVSRGSCEDRGHEFYMRRCISELSKSWYVDSEDDGTKPLYDLLVQLDGWQDSEGAKTEKMVAEACGIEVIELHALADELGRS